jgi:hypothetical protein
MNRKTYKNAVSFRQRNPCLKDKEQYNSLVSAMDPKVSGSEYLLGPHSRYQYYVLERELPQRMNNIGISKKTRML